jgi:hypothetical protein
MIRRRKGPSKPFRHSDDCKIFKADPSVQIEWSEIRRGVWEAVCVCGRDVHYEPVADDRVRLDPLDPATARHGPSCPYRDATEIPSGVLKVDEKDGGYWWCQCAACSFAWQVPFYAPESVAAGT